MNSRRNLIGFDDRNLWFVWRKQVFRFFRSRQYVSVSMCQR